ncbi:MAG: FtsX-like permease family protein, partial [Candidatus Thorarchaeota archaeon]
VNGAPSRTYYSTEAANERGGIQDTRVIPITNTQLDRISAEFNWKGNSTLTNNSVLVSQTFIDHCVLSQGIRYQIGDIVSFDILTIENRRFFTCDSERISNLTIAGIYDIKSLSTFIGEAFPSTMRLNPWTRHPEDRWPVLGISDSIFIIRNNLDENLLHEIEYSGYFPPRLLVRADFQVIMSKGAKNLESTLSAMRDILLEQFPEIRVIAVRELEDITEYIETTLRSQVFTLLGFPIIMMSLFLAVYVSKSSITRRGSEISILRSKGASYNQILSSVVWEALLLSLISIGAGFLLTSILVSLMGSATAPFVFDLDSFFHFLYNVRFPWIGVIIGITIAFYLPGLYMYHIVSNMRVYDIGQPTQKEIPEEIEEGKIWRFTGSFVIVIILIFLLPSIYEPSGWIASLEVISVAILLFAAAYLGSNMMQQMVSRVSGMMRPMLGERFLYVSQSLKRRRSQFIPLMIILSLTLSTTTMMLIETATVEATARNELQYAYGADIRVSTTENSHYIEFNQELESYEWIIKSTAVVQVSGKVGNLPLMLEGIETRDYLNICSIQPDSFNYGNAIDMLEDLDSRSDGIILSEYLGNILNRTEGSQIAIPVWRGEEYYIQQFTIVGFMKSAPGFGFAAIEQADSASIPWQLGIQIRPGGFAFINRRTLIRLANTTNAKYFFAQTYVDPALPEFCSELNYRYDINAETYHYSNIFQEHNDAGIFLRGMYGFTTIGTLLCTAMGLTSIGLFFGAAINERRPEYAIIKALGGTIKQVGSLVLGEFAGLIVAIIGLSLIMGISFGYLMSILIFAISPFQVLLPYVQSFQWHWILAISTADTLVMLLACLYPARIAGSTNMIQELRNL